jgi:hypothetical protein
VIYLSSFLTSSSLAMVSSYCLSQVPASSILIVVDRIGFNTDPDGDPALGQCESGSMVLITWVPKIVKFYSRKKKSFFSVKFVSFFSPVFYEGHLSYR